MAQEVTGSNPAAHPIPPDVKRRQKPSQAAIETNPGDPSQAIEDDTKRHELPQNEAGSAQFPPTFRRPSDGDLSPELARVVDAWPDLPDHIRAAVLALVATNIKRGDMV